MPRIHLELSDHTAHLRLDDGKANVIQDDFLAELSAALDRAEAEARAVVITGREGFFSAGLDLKTLPGLPADAKRAVVFRFARAMLRLYACQLPVLVGMQGHCLAGGCVLSLTADRRIAAEGDYKIGLNEVQIGLPLPTFVIEMARDVLTPVGLRQAVGEGAVYGPERALQVGLVDEVVPAADLAARLHAEAERLGRLSPVAWGLTKQRLRRHRLAAAEQGLEAELDAFLAAGPLGG